MDIQTTYDWLKLYETKGLSINDLARELNISERQAYRIIKRYKELGIMGLYHKNKNQPSHNHIDPAKKERILGLIREKYYDCGASYASELLEEYEGIKINRETLRLWMKSEQLLIKQNHYRS